MKYSVINPPRAFSVGTDDSIELRDCMHIELESDEQVTFFNETTEYDVVKKSWGFYATPSMNGRLIRHNLLTALLRNPNTEMCFICLVKNDQVKDYQKYLADEELEHICWLSDNETLARICNSEKKGVP